MKAQVSRPGFVHAHAASKLRVGVAERNGALRVFKVYWRPQLIVKLVNYLKHNTQIITRFKPQIVINLLLHLCNNKNDTNKLSNDNDNNSTRLVTQGAYPPPNKLTPTPKHHPLVRACSLVNKVPMPELAPCMGVAGVLRCRAIYGSTGYYEYGGGGGRDAR